MFVRRVAFFAGSVMVLAQLMSPAVAQSTSYAGWEWEGRALEPTGAAPDEGRLHPDAWLARDKAMHAGASFLLTLSSQYVWETKLELTEGEALPLAATTALTAGLLKEVLDSQRPHEAHFCYRDLVADAVGVLLAAGVVLF